MKLVNYIPCKSKSRRVPGKNLKRYGGTRLLDYTVEFSRMTKNQGILSTDVANLENEYPDLYFYDRSEEACDLKKTNLEVISIFLRDTKFDFDYLFLLQLTHPIRCLLEYNTIVDYIETNTPMLPVITIKNKADHFMLKNYKDYSDVHGNIYVFPKEHLQANKTITNFIGFYSEQPNINIDTPTDEILFKRFLEQN